MESPIHYSNRLNNVLYDLRGPIQDKADELTQNGINIIPLNVGNPAPFGFLPPRIALTAMREGIEKSNGYSNSLGMIESRVAIANRYTHVEGFPQANIDQILVGNGVSELVNICLQALINEGDEILIPSPDYPLWTASTTLAGGTPVYYPCFESHCWQPDINSIRAAINSRTRAIVIINPNNPTGAVYPRSILAEIAELARKHNLILLSDEIYDEIVFPGATFSPTASIAPNVRCLTFSGLSKSYRLAGLRSAWVVATGFSKEDTLFEGVRLLASMRMCASIPAQEAITALLGKDDSIKNLVNHGGRLYEQKKAITTFLRRIPGVSLVEPEGALYVFLRLDENLYDIPSDEEFVLSFLEEEHIQLVQSSAFNMYDGKFLRLTFLADKEVLEHISERLAVHLQRYKY